MCFNNLFSSDKLQRRSTVVIEFRRKEKEILINLPCNIIYKKSTVCSMIIWTCNTLKALLSRLFITLHQQQSVYGQSAKQRRGRGTKYSLSWSWQYKSFSVPCPKSGFSQFAHWFELCEHQIQLLSSCHATPRTFGNSKQYEQRKDQIKLCCLFFGGGDGRLHFILPFVSELEKKRRFSHPRGTNHNIFQPMIIFRSHGWGGQRRPGQL